MCRKGGKRRGSVGSCGTVEPLQDMTAGPEPKDLLALHNDSLTGSGIAPHSRLANPAGEIAELPQIDPVALRQTVGNFVQDRVESCFHGMPGQMRMRLEQLLQQFRTDHLASFFALPGYELASLTRMPAVPTVSAPLRSSHCS
jgi:hypothetical protein